MHRLEGWMAMKIDERVNWKRIARVNDASRMTAGARHRKAVRRHPAHAPDRPLPVTAGTPLPEAVRRDRVPGPGRSFRKGPLRRAVEALLALCCTLLAVASLYGSGIVLVGGGFVVALHFGGRGHVVAGAVAIFVAVALTIFVPFALAALFGGLAEKLRSG